MAGADRGLAAELRKAEAAWIEARAARDAAREHSGATLDEAELRVQDTEVAYKDVQLRVAQMVRQQREQSQTGQVQESGLTQQDVNMARWTIESRERLARERASQRERERGGREW